MEQEISGLKVCRQLLLLQTLIQIRPQVVIFTGLLQRCKQWGINTGGAVRTSTLPIPFTNVFLAVASTSSEWCCPGCSATNTTVTTRAYQSNRPDVAQPNDVNWIIIGCQPQWGFEETETKTIAFPISFESIKYVFLSKIYGPASGGADTVAYNFFRKSLTGVSFDYAYTRNWLAIGGQQPQWGFTVFDPVDYKNVNFTLPLSVNGTFCAFSTGYDPKGSTFLWHSMSHFNNVNVGVTGFVFDSRYTFTGLGYLAVCWQKQWGKSTGQTTTFPISFTVSALNGFTQYNETGNATGNADQTITSLSKTSITTYRGYGYNYWVIGH